MSDAFYTRLQATATRLITARGREFQLVSTSSTPADPTKPWQEGDGVETVETFRGVFVPPNTVRQFGITALGRGTEFIDMLSRSEQVVIAATGDTDVRNFIKIRDGGVDWGVIATQELKPGNIGLISFIGVRR